MLLLLLIVASASTGVCWSVQDAGSWTPTTEVLHRGNYPDTHEVQLKHQTELQLSESVTLNAESRAQSPQVYNRWSTTAGLQAQIDTCDTNLEGCDARHVQDVKMWKAAADPAYEGDCDEQTNLGYAYLSGRGVVINISTAIYWWTKASNQGCPKAHGFLANMHRFHLLNDHTHTGHSELHDLKDHPDIKQDHPGTHEFHLEDHTGPECAQLIHRAPNIFDCIPHDAAAIYNDHKIALEFDRLVEMHTARDDLNDNYLGAPVSRGQSAITPFDRGVV